MRGRYVELAPEQEEARCSRGGHRACSVWIAQGQQEHEGSESEALGGSAEGSRRFVADLSPRLHPYPECPPEASLRMHRKE